MSIEKWNENWKKRYNENGDCYIVIGDTYSIKDELKKKGGWYCQELGWTLKELHPEYVTVKVNITQVCEISDNGYYHYLDNVNEIVNSLKAPYVEESKSEYIGEVGDRYGDYVEIINLRHYCSAYGDGTVITMQDIDENVLVWFTGRRHDLNVGDMCAINGKIKAHREYNGTKQTMLTRCKIEVIGRKEKENV